MNQRLLLAAFSFLIVFASCKDEKDVDCNLFHWSYEGGSGPNHWGTCTPDCNGQSQSPVNITGAVIDPSLPALSMLYEEVPIDLINNGHTIEFEYPAGSSITLGGLVYALDQFHFHTQSEHTLAGQYYPLEVHLVHKHAASGNLAVIGVFFETGSENAFLQHFIHDLPEDKDDHFSSPTLVNVQDLLPSNLTYYTYAGSLTTPPCLETVTWIVLKTPVSISNTQLQEFTGILHNNYRPIQALFGREIRESS